MTEAKKAVEPKAEEVTEETQETPAVEEPVEDKPAKGKKAKDRVVRSLLSHREFKVVDLDDGQHELQPVNGGGSLIVNAKTLASKFADA